MRKILFIILLCSFAAVTSQTKKFVNFSTGQCIGKVSDSIGILIFNDEISDSLNIKALSNANVEVKEEHQKIKYNGFHRIHFNETYSAIYKAGTGKIHYLGVKKYSETFFAWEIIIMMFLFIITAIAYLDDDETHRPMAVVKFILLIVVVIFAFLARYTEREYLENLLFSISILGIGIPLLLSFITAILFDEISEDLYITIIIFHLLIGLALLFFDGMWAWSMNGLIFLLVSIIYNNRENIIEYFKKKKETKIEKK